MHPPRTPHSPSTQSPNFQAQGPPRSRTCPQSPAQRKSQLGITYFNCRRQPGVLHLQSSQKSCSPSLLPEWLAPKAEASPSQAQTSKRANTPAGWTAEPAPEEGRACRRHSHPHRRKVRKPLAPSNPFRNLTRKSTNLQPRPHQGWFRKVLGVTLLPLSPRF